MEIHAAELRNCVIGAIRRLVGEAGTVTAYREPLVGFASADDPRFEGLRDTVPGHRLPQDLLPGARTVIVLFLTNINGI